MQTVEAGSSPEPDSIIASLREKHSVTGHFMHYKMVALTSSTLAAHSSAEGNTCCSPWLAVRSHPSNHDDAAVLGR